MKRGSPKRCKKIINHLKNNEWKSFKRYKKDIEKDGKSKAKSIRKV